MPDNVCGVRLGNELGIAFLIKGGTRKCAA